MTILAIAVITLVWSVIFFGAFLGFVARDNLNSIALCVLFALLPGAAIAYVCSQLLFMPLWMFSYWLGVQVADFLNQKEY
jgi:hypothetical protein